MISPELNARIAQRLAIDGWEPGLKCEHDADWINTQYGNWTPKTRWLCGCGLTFKAQRGVSCPEHDIPCPDLRTPDNLAKVEAALIALGDVDFGTAYCAEEQLWGAWASRTIEKPEIRADTKAEALLTAIDKLVRTNG